MGRVFFLEASGGGRIHLASADGSDQKVIVTGCRIPDGIVVDLEAGHIYWTNMGVPTRNDGSIERADLEGQNRKTIIPEGGTFTPKHTYIAPDLFTADTPLGTYQGMTDQIVLSRTPGAFRTVMVPRGSSKPEWLTV
jgi:hypothetical protein